MTETSHRDTPESTTRHGECVVNSSGSTYSAKQGGRFGAGISAQTVGSRGLCMHAVNIPPGTRERPHFHRDHETAIYVISGSVEVWSGPDFENRFVISAGDFLYIPPNVPHVPINRSPDEPCLVVLSRTDPNEQESVEVLHTSDELQAVAPLWTA
jgi:uncharacterized RmlC-like cupin family protein